MGNNARVSIPEDLKRFGRELVELARKHNIRKVSAQYKGRYDCYDWHEAVSVSWEQGRHEAEGELVFQSEFRVSEREGKSDAGQQ